MRQLRRKDKAMPDGAARSVLEQAEIGVLSTADAQGEPYGVPLNFIVLNNEIVFHCAKDGRKNDNMRANPKGSFCVFPQYSKCASEYTYAYRSVIAEGALREVADRQELVAALMALSKKYLPLNETQIMQVIDKDIARVSVWAMSIDHICGKASYEDRLN